VQVLLDLLAEELEDVLLAVLQPAVLDDDAQVLRDLLLVLDRHELAQVRVADDRVDLLQVLLVLDLRVLQQEHRGQQLGARLLQHLPDVLLPVAFLVALRGVDREEGQALQVARELRQRLPARPAHPDQQRVTRVQPHDPQEPAHVLQRRREKHDVERLLNLQTVELALLAHELHHLLLRAGHHLVVLRLAHEVPEAYLLQLLRAELLPELPQHVYLQLVEEQPVLVVRQSVEESPPYLVDPGLQKIFSVHNVRMF